MEHRYANTARNLDQSMRKAAQLGQYDKFCTLFESVEPTQMELFAKESWYFLEGALAFFVFDPHTNHSRLLTHVVAYMQHTPPSEAVNNFCRTLLFHPDHAAVRALAPAVTVVDQRGLVAQHSVFKPELDCLVALLQNDALVQAIGQPEGVGVIKRRM